QGSRWRRQGAPAGAAEEGLPGYHPGSRGREGQSSRGNRQHARAVMEAEGEEHAGPGSLDLPGSNQPARARRGGPGRVRLAAAGLLGGELHAAAASLYLEGKVTRRNAATGKARFLPTFALPGNPLFQFGGGGVSSWPRPRNS